MKTTILTFDQAGGIKSDATGFTGKACEETTEKLLKGIGAETVKNIKKPEYQMVGKSTSGVTQRNW